ncbi:hypothetical protein LXL04_020497 [Taraxacum kok-saghyz]
MDSYTSPPPSSLIILFKRASRSAFFRSADQKSCHQALVFSLFVKSSVLMISNRYVKIFRVKNGNIIFSYNSERCIGVVDECRHMSIFNHISPDLFPNQEKGHECCRRQPRMLVCGEKARCRLITKWCEIQGQTKQQSVTSNLTSKSRYACKVTLAHLKDKPAHALSSSSSSIGISSGVKSTAAKLLGGGNGSRALSFVGDWSGDPSFPVIKDQNQFSVSHARYSKNPIARWHICQGSINSIAFSSDGAYIAIVGSDGAYIAINST